MHFASMGEGSKRSALLIVILHILPVKCLESSIVLYGTTGRTLIRHSICRCVIVHKHNPSSVLMAAILVYSYVMCV